MNREHLVAHPVGAPGLGWGPRPMVAKVRQCRLRHNAELGRCRPLWPPVRGYWRTFLHAARRSTQVPRCATARSVRAAIGSARSTASSSRIWACRSGTTVRRERGRGVGSPDAREPELACNSRPDGHDASVVRALKMRRQDEHPAMSLSLLQMDEERDQRSLEEGCESRAGLSRQLADAPDDTRHDSGAPAARQAARCSLHVPV